jgi:adenylate cyclase
MQLVKKRYDVTMNQTFSEQSVEQRLTGSALNRFWTELFSNSGQFPIAIVLLEFLKDGFSYLARPDFYILVPSSMLQSYFLSRQSVLPAWQKFFGNLIAPALYTVVEMFFEGMEFFTAPQHIAYLVIALLIATLQTAQVNLSGFLADFLLIVENVIRAQILFILYVVFETIANPAQTFSIAEFFKDTSHRFIGLATFLLGLSVGFANANAQRHLNLLRQTAGQLRIYSEWLLGRNLLGRAFNDPNSMLLSRQRRTVLFMDIRGFTKWSEKRSPEEVASLLNRYYMNIESLLNNYQVIKYKFTADEVMAVFMEADEAVRAARELQETIGRTLLKRELGVGIGINTGLLVEGLLGGQNVRFYDVIGDTVNTTARIEKSAGAGEIWISEDTRSNLSNRMVGAQKEIVVKGKDQPIKVYSIL